MRKFLILFTCVILYSCKGDTFDRSQILINVADHLILPTYNNFAHQIDTLYSQAQLFTENPNAENLSEVRNAWKKTIFTWKKAEVYNFGPIEQQFLVSAIDHWPTSEDGIETAVDEFEAAEDYLLRIGSNRKGLPAIEYLLFHASDAEVIRAFKDENRKAYLLLLIEKLEGQIQLVIKAWEDSYRNEFIKDEGNTASSGITLLANEMGHVLGTVRHEKLGIPNGEQTGGTPRLHMLESRHANISKVLIRETLKGVQLAFNGVEGKGFDDYLSALNIQHENDQLLSEAINNKFAQAYQIIDSMEGTLREAIENDSESVMDLIVVTQELYVLVNVDMFSQLGLISVFSDNDGD